MNHVFTEPVGLGPELKPAPLAPVASYALGAALGGGVLGAMAGTIHVGLNLAGQGLLVSVGVLMVLAGVACEYLRRVKPLPERPRQVPTRWMRWRRRTLTAAAFGFLLGWGIWTWLHHASFYAFVGCLVIAQPTAAMAGGILYGAARGSVLLATWATRWTSQLHRKMLFFRMAHAREVLLATSVTVLVIVVIGS